MARKNNRDSEPIFKERRTPFGDYKSVSNNYYTGGDGQPWSMNWAGLFNGDAGLQAGSYGNPASPTYFGSALLPGYERYGEYLPTFNKTFGTPLGALNFESNYEIPNSIDANFTPNDKTQAYINALKNALAETPAVVSNAARDVWNETKANPMGTLQNAIPSPMAALANLLNRR